MEHEFLYMTQYVVVSFCNPENPTHLPSNQLSMKAQRLVQINQKNSPWLKWTLGCAGLKHVSSCLQLSIEFMGGRGVLPHNWRDIYDKTWSINLSIAADH